MAPRGVIFASTRIDNLIYWGINMAGDPHNKVGKKCSRCPHIFTKQNLALTITTKQGNHNASEIVCAACHHKHYEQGE